MKKTLFLIGLLVAITGVAFADAGGGYLPLSSYPITTPVIVKTNATFNNLRSLNSDTSIAAVAKTSISIAATTTESITSGTTQTITSGTTQTITSGTTQVISAASGQMISCVANNITITAAAGDVVISAPTAGNNAFYQVVSGAAQANVYPMKIEVGLTPAQAAGINVTLSAGAVFTNANSYWVFVTEYGSAAQPTLGTRVTKINGSHFTVSGDASSTYQWMAIGY